jgi:hypothetical protein
MGNHPVHPEESLPPNHAQIPKMPPHQQSYEYTIPWGCGQIKKASMALKKPFR